MSREERRGKTGWWLFALIGLLLAAAGIRYASSSEWWASIVNRQRQNFQTVNTGASVQVAASTTDRTPIDEGNTPPQTNNPDPNVTAPQDPPRRMW